MYFGKNLSYNNSERIIGMKRILLFFVFTLASLHAQEKPAAKLGGYMFGDIFYNVARDTAIGSMSNAATTGVQDLNGFQFRRIYLTYDGDISPAFTSRLRLEGSVGAPFIKDAYIKWKNIFDGSDLVFGLQPTPAFEVSETIWGYRSLEKTIMDLRGIVSPRDLSVSLRGKMDEQGMLGYWIMFGNNSGTGSESDKYKRLYGHLQILPAEKILVTVYADYKLQRAVNDLKSTSIPKATLTHNVLTTALFAGYADKGSFNAGVEGFLQSTPNDYKDGSPDSLVAKNAIGVSVFGSVNIGSDLVLIGRFDFFDPNTHSKGAGDTRNYFILGADWKAEKNVSIIPNIQYETYEEAGGRSYDPSLTARITLFYTFL